MTTVHGVGRGKSLCKSIGRPPDWNKNHDEKGDGNVMNAAHVGVLYITGYEAFRISGRWPACEFENG